MRYRVEVTMDRELYTALVRYCESQDRSPGNLLRHAGRAYLSKNRALEGSDTIRPPKIAGRAVVEPAEANGWTIPGWVYCFGGDMNGKFVCKIGLSSNHKKRLAGISVPFKIRSICEKYVENMKEGEALMHGAWGDRRINGEWFDMTGVDINDIKASFRRYLSYEGDDGR